MSVPKELFSLNEAAEFLGITVPTFRLKLRTGEYKIPMVRFGHLIKFHKSDLDAFIEAHKQQHPAAG
jgi:excisionase family DNA binding protein